MTTDTRPADTRMMDIVHNALRRDVARAQSALTRWPYPDPGQRAAIVKHLRWMMEFLHRHHHIEDDGLYPLVRQRVPEAAPILDAMDADHGALIPVIDTLNETARRYAQEPSARTELISALDDLESVMLPHLEREEREMMPVVSAAVTKAEWDAVELAHFHKLLAPAQLVFIAHWVSDEASDEDRAVVRSAAPKAVARAIETLTARSYRRRAWRCWYLPQHARARQRTSGQVSIEIAAPIEVVWKLIADPLHTLEWGHEHCRVRFVDDASPAALDRRFIGSDRSRRYRWSRTCTIFTCDEPREFGYITSAGPGDATAWHFRLEPTPRGTRLSQAFQCVALPRWLSRLVGVPIPGHHDRTDALRRYLVRLSALAEAEQQRAVSSRRAATPSSANPPP